MEGRAAKMRRGLSLMEAVGEVMTMYVMLMSRQIPFLTLFIVHFHHFIYDRR